MLILRINYEHFESDGSHNGDYSLTPQEGDIEYPEATQGDIPKIAHEFLTRAFGLAIADTVYGKNKYSTVFVVEYKEENVSNQKYKYKFLITPENYKAKFHIGA